MSDEGKQRRRPRGSGSDPVLMADGRWRAQFSVQDRDGKRQRVSVYGPSKAVCADRLREALNKRDAGVLVAGRAPTLEAWLDHWLNSIAGPNLRETTRSGYAGYIRTWITETRLGRKRLNKVTAQDLDALYRRMRERGRAPATILQMHHILGRAFKIAVRRRLLAVPPTSLMDAPKVGDFEPDVLSLDETRRLINAASTVEGGVNWMFALALGPRQGERLGLGWDMVDLAEGTVRISRTLQPRKHKHGCAVPERCSGPAHRCPERFGGGLVFGPPKSRAGRRTAVMPAPLAEAFRRHREEQLAARTADWAPYVDPDGVEVDLVFCQPNGRPITSQADRAAWHAFLDGAGVPRLRVHDARHTAATVLLVLGVDPRVVMDLLGWSQASMLTRYQHVIDEVKRSTAETLGSALWADPAPRPPRGPEGGVVSLSDWRARKLG